MTASRWLTAFATGRSFFDVFDIPPALTSPLVGPHGTYDNQRSRVGLRPSIEENLAPFDDMGGPLTYNHYPFGRTMAPILRSSATKGTRTEVACARQNPARNKVLART